MGCPLFSNHPNFTWSLQLLQAAAATSSPTWRTSPKWPFTASATSRESKVRMIPASAVAPRYIICHGLGSETAFLDFGKWGRTWSDDIYKLTNMTDCVHLETNHNSETQKRESKEKQHIRVKFNPGLRIDLCMHFCNEQLQTSRAMHGSYSTWSRTKSCRTPTSLGRRARRATKFTWFNFTAITLRLSTQQHQIK